MDAPVGLHSHDHVDGHDGRDGRSESGVVSTAEITDVLPESPAGRGEPPLQRVEVVDADDGDHVALPA